MTSRPSSGLSGGDRLFAAVILTVAAGGGLMWLGACTAALLTGAPVPRQHVITRVARLLQHPGQPATAWGQPMPGAGWYWTITTVAVLLVAAAVLGLVVAWRRASRRPGPGLRRPPGLAGGAEVRRAASRRSLLHRAATLRPSLDRPRPDQVGYLLGRATGRQVWISAEDSVIVLGPPRSGKGLHLVIPMILDAPGPVVTTSTRPDNLTATLRTREAHGGPVAVFDPQALAPGAPARLRWSPIRGCEHPQTAIIRARALAAGTSRGVDGADFWQANTEAVLRALLHAAALDGRTPQALYRWSLSPAAAAEAVRILTGHGAAGDGWAESLDAALNADPRTRDSIWAGVRTALGALADPRVLDALTPRAGDRFDPAEFLQQCGTLYLLGTAAGTGAAANIIGAWLEDIIDTARHLAGTSTGTRLDPPLALILDEIANYPLPSLPMLMSEGGGSGITTVAVLQSLSQARSTWGEHHGTALWDSAIAKIILGGGSNARDLADLAALIGDRDEAIDTETRDPGGRRSISRTLRRVPVMDASTLRTLPFGTGIVLLRTAHPILLDLTAWTARPDAAALATHQAALEHANRAAVPR